MDNLKVFFLILHYKNDAETVACVDSILKLDCDAIQYKIQIVDNGSKNGSYERLCERYRGSSQIEVDEAEDNLGFSRGNNFGLEILRKKFGIPDFLVVCNSDVIFTQKQFSQGIADVYARNPFDVMGPNILVERKGRFVPTSPGYPGVAETHNIETCLAVFRYRQSLLKKETTKSLRMVKMSFPSVSMFLRYAIYMAKFWGYRFETQKGRNEGQNGTLQGACLIFSRNYLERYTKLFEPETFLYSEEEILFLRAKKEKLILLYSPSLEVWHKEGKSSGLGLADAKKKYLKYLDSRIASLEQLRELSL